MAELIDVQVGLITKLLETKDIITVKDLQIKPMFFSGENKQVFSYIDKYYQVNNDVPTVRLIKQNFPQYELETYHNENMDQVIGTEEPLRFWCREVRKRTKHNKLADVTEQLAKTLSSGDEDEAYTLLKKTVMYLENEVEESKAIDITKDTQSRKELYLERKRNKGMIGIPTGIDKLDFILKGLQAKQLVTMIAMTGLGKTFFQVVVGAYAMLNNYTVLQLVTEMSEEQMQDRYEAMLYGMMKGEFSYSRFKSGMLNDEEEEGYFDFLENTLPKLEPLIIETATGASNVSALVDKYEPDLVMVDSAYLMEDDRGSDQDWLRIAHITRDLKQIAKNRKIPIFINSQADSNTSRKTGPEMGNMSFSKHVGSDSDVVLALFRDEQMLEDAEMQVKVLKQREGTLGNVMMNWDFSNMDFSAIYSTSQDPRNDTGTSSASGIIEI